MRSGLVASDYRGLS